MENVLTSFRESRQYLLIALLLLLLSIAIDLAIGQHVEVWLPMFLLSTFFSHLSRDIGIAVVIALFVSHFIEDRHRQRLESSMDSKVKAIAENVFSGVYNSDLPTAIVGEAIEQVLKAKVVRTSLDITYTLRNDTITEPHTGSRSFVLLTAVTEFVLENISKDSTEVTLGVVLPNPILPVLQSKVAVTKFCIGDGSGDPKPIDVRDPQSAMVKELQEGNARATFVAEKRVLNPRQKVHIYAEYQMAKESEDTEVLRSRYPTQSLVIRVVDLCNPQLRIWASAIHPVPLHEQTSANTPGQRIWKIRRPLLPHQGVMFWWKKP